MTSHNAQPAGVPLELSSFVGRSAEIDHVAPLVLRHRLVTLTGAGGAGKSRLALAVARCLAPEFSDGVCVVELASLTDPSLLARAVSQAVGLVEPPSDLVAERLAAHLAERELLLILDNCEHLVEGAAEFAQHLLTACCSDLRILVTSRERLGVPGETIYRVPPLASPPPPQAGRSAQREDPLGSSPSGWAQPEPHAMEAYDAVRLFLERAREASPDFALTPENAVHVATICRRLDGMPLAIELAAARVSVLTPEQIVARLEHMTGLLSSSTRRAPVRHRTIRAAIGWSYAMLTPDIAAAFRRLSAFSGGFGPEAAAAVCADVITDPDEMLDTLVQLVEKSLIIARPRGGEMRYYFLETIRQFAADELRAHGEDDAARERHLAFHLALAERASREMRSPRLLHWLDRLDLEHDDMRAALRCALGKSDNSVVHAEQALRLATALEQYWEIRNHLSEGRMWLDRALAASQASGQLALRGRALTAAAGIGWCHGGGPESEPIVQESIRLWRALQPDHPEGLADALRLQGKLRWALGDYGPARSLLEESLELYRRVGDERGMAGALWIVGATWIKEDIERAKRVTEQALAIYEQYEDPDGSQARVRLGTVNEMAGAYDAARPLYERFLAEARERQDPFTISYALLLLARLARRTGRLEESWTYLSEEVAVEADAGLVSGDPFQQMGYLLLAQGRAGEASTHLLEAIELFRQVGDERGIAGCLTAFSHIRAAGGQALEAARLLGAADALCGREGGGPYWFDEADRVKCLEALRAQLPEDRLAAARSEGAQLSLEDAIQLGNRPVELHSSSRTPLLTPLKAAKVQYGGLTAREREVAAWVACGKTNREIAAQLVVTERTVEAHVGNILSKLEFRSRTQISAWATEKGLVSGGCG